MDIYNRLNLRTKIYFFLVIVLVGIFTSVYFYKNGLPILSNSSLKIQSNIVADSFVPSTTILFKNETDLDIQINKELILSLPAEGFQDNQILPAPSALIIVLEDPKDVRLIDKIQNGKGGYFYGYGSETLDDSSINLYLYANKEETEQMTRRLNYAFVASIMQLRYPAKQPLELSKAISQYYLKNMKDAEIFQLKSGTK